MAQTYSHALGSVDSLDKRQWALEVVEVGHPDGRVIRMGDAIVIVRISIRCGQCGAIDILEPQMFTISPDGRVLPRWWCPTSTCSESAFIVLENYGEWQR